MRVPKRVLAIVYLACAVVALGTFAGLYWGPYTHRFMLMMRDPIARIAVTVCGAVVALGVLVGVIRLMFARREPDCVHPAGAPDIEVTLSALSSCARRAAAGCGDVLIDRVDARVQGGDAARVRFKIDAIALDDHDLAARAAQMQTRVEEACETMLGASGATARVRFLPAKTTVKTVEVSGE